MDIIGIDLSDQNMSMACAKVRLRYSWISLIDISGIDLFNQNVGMACAKIRFRCSWISLVVIYFI